jgi:hypothetical protein
VDELLDASGRVFEQQVEQGAVEYQFEVIGYYSHR